MSASYGTSIACLLGLTLTMGSVTSAVAAATPIGETTFGGKIFVNASHLGQYNNGKRTDVSRSGVYLTRL